MQSGPFKCIFDLCNYYLQLIDKIKEALCTKPKDDPAVFIQFSSSANLHRCLQQPQSPVPAGVLWVNGLGNLGAWQEYIKRGEECRTAHILCVTAVRMVHDL